jgi:hypothetical protein
MMKRILSVAATGAALALAAAPVARAQDGVVPAPATKLPLKHAPRPTTAAITPADLMTRLYIFADDSMQGREAGTIGNVKGTDYIASEVKRMGLVPAGDNGTYFQTIPFKTRAVDANSKVVAGGTTLAYGQDWAVLGSSGVHKANLDVVFGGVLGTENLISPEAAAGKLVVFNLANPAAMRASPAMSAIARSAAFVAVIAPPMYMQYFGRPSQFVDDPSAAAPQQPTMMFMSAEGAAKLFEQPLTQLTPGAAGKATSVDVDINVTPVPYPARNVVAILPGSDPRLKNEYVAIGGHNDHIGFNMHPVDHDSIRIWNHIVRPEGADDGGKQATPAEQAEVNKQLAEWRAAHPGTARLDSISNGADDDGTGSVSVLEIAEKLASLKPAPRRSILFVWHVGEEKGLLGSAYFTDHPTVPRDSIVAQLNMDMVGRGDAWDETGRTKEGKPIHGNPDYLQLVGSRRLSTELGDLIEKVNKDDHHNLDFDYSIDADGHPANIYCRSDHYEYARYGIPITFFTTGLHSDYHQVTDEPEYIDYEHMARVDNLIEDVAVHVANLDHRVVVDHPKPDPHGACRQ